MYACMNAKKFLCSLYFLKKHVFFMFFYFFNVFYFINVSVHRSLYSNRRGAT